ncbi:MAG: hypothetical protein ACRD1T_11835, partial [Acidimicrobiia bacterium]
APKSRRAGKESVPKILILDPDPYLAFLIQLDLPRAEVIEADTADDLQGLIDSKPDLLIVDLTNRRATDLLAIRGDTRAIGIIEGARASRTAIPKDLDGVLLRPFVPAELHRAVRRALGLSQPSEAPESSRLRRLQSLLGPVRVAAIAITAVLEAASGELEDPVRVLFIAGAFLFVALRFFSRRGSQFGAAVDVLFATLILAATGGLSSNYLPFGLTASFEAGLVFRLRTGWMAGALVAMGSFAEVITAVQAGDAPRRELVAWFLLFPTASLAAGFAAKVLGGGGESEEMLAEANRILSTLHRIARAMPGSLEVGGVAADALREAQETFDSSAGAVLIGEAGMVAPVASYGITRTDELILPQDDPFLTRMMDGPVRILKLNEMPEQVQVIFEHECWLAAPLQHGGVPSGLIVVECRDESRHESNKLLLQQIARETSVALENARLFGQVRELSVDEERRRLAREPHDGVAQALAHIRLE